MKNDNRMRRPSPTHSVSGQDTSKRDEAITEAKAILYASTAEDAKHALGAYYVPLAQADTEEEIEFAVQELARTYRGSIRLRHITIYCRALWYLKRFRKFRA